MTTPHLLIIMSDQHNRRIMGCAGDPVVRTPQLDALAARGVLFDQTYCAIHSGPWKLNSYYGYEHPQLFNLALDPDETRDLGQEEQWTEVRRALLARVCAGWPAAEIAEKLACQREGWPLVDRWCRSVPLGESELWSMPAGSNAFPESQAARPHSPTD